MLEKKNILGIGITSATIDKTLEYIIKGLEKDGKKYFVVTPNPEILVLASKDSQYKKILNEAKIAIVDGIGVVIAAKVLGRPLKERFTGVDLLENLCSMVAEKPITVGFLGGRHGVAEKTAECLRKKYPGLKICFVGEEWSDSFLRPIARGPATPFPPTGAPASLANAANAVRASGSPSSRVTPRFSIDILFVAFGATKQEIWISENLNNLPVKVAIGVGGAFDYISGRVPRAPLFIRQIGFEWLFRLIIQPWRIKRQLALLEFAFLVLKEKIGNIK